MAFLQEGILMFFRIAKITLCAIAILTGFAIIGLFTRPLLDAAKVSDSKSDSVIPQNCGAGIAFAMLGGYRTLLADFVWIKGYIDWERQDLSGCVSAIDLATTLDPDSVFYWRFGAGIIAFDTPHWILRKLGTSDPARQAAVKRRQGIQAIKFLDKALTRLPNNTELILQKGQIAISIGDFKLAEECYAKVVSVPDPSVFSRRIYAAVLERNGKFAQAKGILEKILGETEKDSPLVPILKKQIGTLQNLIEKTSAKKADE